MAEFLSSGTFDYSYPPIVSKRNPTSNDRAELGTIWVNKSSRDVFIIADVAANLSYWIPCGGGTGTFTTLNISGASVLAGAVTVSGFTAGVVQSSSVGLLSSSKGTNGQVLIGSTAGVPAWANVTCPDGSIVVTSGANTIALTATGATVSSYVSDSGTATPALGVLTVSGGSNLATTGSGSTLTVALISSPSVSGSLTAGVGLNMTSGTCTLTSNTNAAQAIYLHANAGVNETIDIYSQLGTSANSINIHSLVGGVTVASAYAGATALNLTASNAAGGLTSTVGTGGYSFTATNGIFSVATGTAAINIGTDSVAKTVTVGSVTGGAATVIQSGSGNTSLTSTGTITAAATGIVSLNSTGGNINIGDGANAHNINIGTGAAQRTITVGNATGTTNVIVNTGSSGLAINAGGIVTMQPATDSQAAATVTINANVGVGTFTGITTAAAATATLTVTNSLISATSAIMCSLSTLGSNDAQCTITRVQPGTGSFVVTYKNNGAAAINGNLILTFWKIA